VAGGAGAAFVLVEDGLRGGKPAFGVVTPFATQWAAFEEECCANAVAVVQAEALDVEYLWWQLCHSNYSEHAPVPSLRGTKQSRNVR